MQPFKILIAEDSLTSRLLLTRTLQKLGYEVAIAQDGEEAWNLYQKEVFTLLILDWLMPGLDGLEVCRRVRAAQGARYTYIILLTSLSSKKDYLEAMQAGTDDFIAKPVEEDQLAARLLVAQRILAEMERRRQAEKEAAQANKAKSEFLSRMSHELRTPLNSILGFAQLLEMGDLDEVQGENVAHIIKGGEHLLELINEVLDLSRIEAGKLSLSAEPVNFSTVCDEAIALVRPIAAQRAITLHNHSRTHNHGSTTTTFVQADRQRLKQVILNLLSNAIKYNKDGGQVILQCVECSTERVKLCVTDTGSGMTTAQQARLFIPFDRLGAETTSVEGTGIGLVLSRHLMEAMGGTLDAESVPGEGSTFCMTLQPAQDPLQTLHTALSDYATKKSDEAAPQDSHAAKKTVLYIEDNLSNLQLLQHLMQTRADIELLWAMQGPLGIEMARQQQPDLILLDLHLPEMNGDEVLRRLRADETTREIPIIIISADATPRRIQQLLDSGARSYLTKPINVREFLKELDLALQAAPSQ